jgi:ribonucleoside-diphosphate reductase alpha chain
MSSKLKLINSVENSYLPTPYEQYIHVSRYARWTEASNRRETWEETVSRYCNFFDNRFGGKFSDFIQGEMKQSILSCRTMPSMRTLMTAGEALNRENVAGFNCSYLAVNTKRSFSEALYILMCGTGVGFSCERQEISQLPVVPGALKKVEDVIVVEDSKLGWAKAFKRLISALYEGDIPTIDYSRVRPAGARLKTFGGRASGPAPLRRLFEYSVEQFKKASGRKLNSLEVHDLMCVIGEIVVVGGVRRSALISLSNLSDQRLRDAKSGQWWVDHPERALANNSIAYTEKPEVEIFMEEWLSLVKSKSGERGVFNRVAAQKQAEKFGRDPNANYGCNPCSEILLKDKQFCNLTEVVVRAEDTFETLKEKVRVATIMGTFQSSMTDFKFLSEQWIKNTQDEALLGVSLTGIMDNELMSGSRGHDVLTEILNDLRDYSIEVNKEWAEKIGVKPSASITCVKPSGTVSSLVNSASGIHTRHSKYYIRTVRSDKKDPLYQFMQHKGVPVEDDVMKPATGAVFSFAIKSPEGCLTRDSLTAIEHLELWLLYQREWCMHKPSVTISVKDNEWPSVGAWVWEHFDEVSGVSFLPHSNHSYSQAPFQEITEAEYEQWVKDHPLPHIDWTELCLFEKEDTTVSSQTLACTAGVCEL